MLKIIFYLIITILIIHFTLYYFNFDFDFKNLNYFKMEKENENKLDKENGTNMKDNTIDVEVNLSLNECINELKTLNECINNGEINTSFS